MDPVKDFNNATEPETMDWNRKFANVKTKQQIVQIYMKQIAKIRPKPTVGIDFDRWMVREHFRSTVDVELVPDTNKNWFVFCRPAWKFINQKRSTIFLTSISILTIFLLVNYKNEVSTLFMRNIQTYIYPGMRLWRKITIPVIETFPQLTEYYDETCLLSNPFFQIKGLDCTPCQSTVNVLIGDRLSGGSYPGPTLYKTNTTVNLSEFNRLYVENRALFQQQNRVKSTKRTIRMLDDLFREFLNETDEPIHNIWRCNRMDVSRPLRKLFRWPDCLPTTGIGVDRFIAIDSPIAGPYPLPETDCSNMFIVQAQGTRTIVLRPTSECRYQCRTLSIRLPESYLLTYDWWYWKPISVADQHSKMPTISYIGSYC